MKLNNTLIIAALAIASASFASAQVSITIIGSTAARITTQNTLQNSVFDTTPTPVKYAWTGDSNSDKATRSIWKGKIAGNDYIVNCSWSGSSSGIRDVSLQNNVTIIDPALDLSVPANNGFQASPATTTSKAQFAMSDVFQSSTTFTSPTLGNNNVFVIGFTFITNPTGSAAGITNMTPQLFNKIYKATAGTNLSFVTGNAADTVKIYGTGRNDGSGTRITALAELGYGTATAVQNFRLRDNGTSITGFQQWPSASTGFGTFEALSTNNLTGNGGYNDNLETARLLSLPSTSANIYASTDSGFASPGTARTIYPVSYIGVGDVIAGNTQLTYNGVAYSAANVYSGKYTFWGYEHCYSKPVLTTGTPSETAFLTKFTSGVIDPNLTAGSTTTSATLMKVSRSTDGASVL